MQTVSEFHGRQVWEFDPDAGTDEERAKVELLRQDFTENRFRRRESQDLLMRMQLTGEKHLRADMPAATKLADGDEVTEEILHESLRRALGWMSALSRLKMVTGLVITVGLCTCSPSGSSRCTSLDQSTLSYQKSIYVRYAAISTTIRTRTADGASTFWTRVPCLARA